MNSSNAPKDGDFAAYLAQRQPAAAGAAKPGLASGATPRSASASTARDPSTHQRQSINDILERGEEPTDEFLEEFNALEGAESLSDQALAQQALAQQALAHPGADGDASTPE